MIDVLPAHVFFIGFVRQISYISHLFFFEPLHNVRIQSREKFAVFNQRCFTSTAISGLFDAEEENLWGEEGEVLIVLRLLMEQLRGGSIKTTSRAIID